MSADAEPEPKRPSLAGRALRAVPKLLLSVAIGLVGLELLLRHSLFGDSTIAERLGAYTRKPELYADRHTEDVYWVLSRIFQGTAGKPAPGPDELLGWRGRKKLHPEHYGHRDEQVLDGRRAVLLFGDSFAACNTSSEDCFEGLFARSERAEDALLLNYGVGGYGLDQIYLLMRESLKHWDEHPGPEKPFVVVSLLVDDDLDRCAVSLRGWPKPRFHLDGDELVLEPPGSQDFEEWLDENPLGVRSYLWRFLVHGSGLLPAETQERFSGSERRTGENREVCKALLAAMQHELVSRELDYCFLLFRGVEGIRSPHAFPWQNRCVLRSFKELNAPFVDTRYDFGEHRKTSGLTPEEYFGWEGTQAGHYNPLGNQVALRTVLRALDGESDARRAWANQPGRNTRD